MHWFNEHSCSKAASILWQLFCSSCRLKYRFPLIYFCSVFHAAAVKLFFTDCFSSGSSLSMHHNESGWMMHLTLAESIVCRSLESYISTNTPDTADLHPVSTDSFALVLNPSALNGHHSFAALFRETCGAPPTFCSFCVISANDERLCRTNSRSLNIRRGRSNI